MMIADALSVHGVPVVEILSESTYRMHKFTSFAVRARVEILPEDGLAFPSPFAIRERLLLPPAINHRARNALLAGTLS
jgi:hypothetical protein